jgi:erythromycin esterase-like protein
MPGLLGKRLTEAQRHEIERELSVPKPKSLATTRELYWHLGRKPRWVIIGRTRHRFYALNLKKYYESLGFPVRLVKYAHEYHVELYDPQSPLLTHHPYPEEKHKHRSLRKKLRELI